jgi:N-acetylglucosaminyl-diphospho-decaprenol L-rhamnosyltransferase
VGFTAVIVHWNQAVACSDTIAQFRAQDDQMRIIVVDNGSADDQLTRLRSTVEPLDRVSVIEVGDNIGFGPGANVGLDAWLVDGQTEWCLVCPHDIELGDDCLEQMAEVLDSRPMAGLACADVGDGETPMIDPYFGGVTRPAELASGWESADYPHGTLMAIRRGCAEEIGLFDERFFAYCEEADLGIRARRAGWKVGLIRGARVQNTHLGSTVAAVDYLQQRNTLMLVREMSGRYHTFIRMMISLLHLWSGWRHPERRPPVFHPRARLLGMRDFLLRRTGRPPPELFVRDA